MPDGKRFFLTTAIDYPNSRPHIGTAFEKIGADVQARYRRMEGCDVFFLMGNDENTVKVARKAAELGQDVKAYCDDMARQFQEVWRALDISYDAFIQTSADYHHHGCQKFIQKVHDNGKKDGIDYIYKGSYEGWYCDGCESFKTEKDLENGLCPIHKTPAVRRVEPCHFFRLSAFQDRLLRFYEENPDFIQPESRRNEILSLVQTELKDVNITRHDQKWGIKVPFDPEFTIWVWFDALLNYITAIGYGTDEALFQKWWPAEMHFIGKDITRFHCALWPAMLMAAGLPTPKKVFGHGFVYIKKEESGVVEKISKSLGNVVEPMEVVSKYSSESFRYYFLRECPFPADGEFSWQRFRDVHNSDLANKLGNLYSRVVNLINKNFAGTLPQTRQRRPESLAVRNKEGILVGGVNPREIVQQVQKHVEACQYNQALDVIWRQIVDPGNQYADFREPWKLVKVDREAAGLVLFDLTEPLRMASILLKPFIPRSARKIYESFNFQPAWDNVRYQDAWDYDWQHPWQTEDLRVTVVLEKGKDKSLFPQIE